MKQTNRRLALAAFAAPAALIPSGASGSVVSIVSSRDNTLYEYPTGDYSNGIGNALFAGNTATSSKRRGLVRFDLQAGLPSNAIVNSASLQLTSNKALTTSDVFLHVAQKDWGEGASDAGPTGGGGTIAEPGDATWLHTFYNTSLWTIAGGDYSATVSASASMSVGPATFASPALTANVQSWVSSPATNFGWAVLGDETATFTAKRIASREDANPADRPTLTVDYSASTWKTASASWSGAGNWDFGVAGGVGAEANFTHAIPGNPTAVINVNVDGPRTLAILNITSPNPYALSGSPLTLDRVSGRNAITVNNGGHLIASNVNVNKSTDVAITSSSTLTMNGTLTVAGGASIAKSGGGTLIVNNVRADELIIDGGAVTIANNGGNGGTSKVGSLDIPSGRLDLRDNKLIVAGAAAASAWNGTSYGGVAGLVQSGYNGGDWSGSGIVTSQSDAVTPNVLTALVTMSADDAGYAGGSFGGQSVASGDQIVFYTWGGDANADGTLNGDDYFEIDSNIAAAGTVFGYTNGDFNYDGDINGDDYFIIDSNINIGQNSPPFPTAAGGAAQLTSVPEPGGIIIWALATAVCRRRRRRQSIH